MEYSLEQLKEITAIVEKNGKLKDVANFMNVCEKTIRKGVKENIELKMAVSKGRKAGYYLKYDVVKQNISQIEKVAKETGQRTLVAQFLNTDIGKLRRTERVYPFLSLAVRRGLAKYKADKKAAKLSGNKSTTTEEQTKSSSIGLFQSKKPKRELIAKLGIIEDISEENALARYRRMKEAEKEANILKQVKNIGEII